MNPSRFAVSFELVSRKWQKPVGSINIIHVAPKHFWERKLAYLPQSWQGRKKTRKKQDFGNFPSCFQPDWIHCATFYFRLLFRRPTDTRNLCHKGWREVPQTIYEGMKPRPSHSEELIEGVISKTWYGWQSKFGIQTRREDVDGPILHSDRQVVKCLAFRGLRSEGSRSGLNWLVVKAKIVHIWCLVAERTKKHKNVLNIAFAFVESSSLKLGNGGKIWIGGPSFDPATHVIRIQVRARFSGLLDQFSLRRKHPSVAKSNLFRASRNLGHECRRNIPRNRGRKKATKKSLERF